MNTVQPAKLAEWTSENGLAVADFYEYSMAIANMEENYFGLQSVFDLVVRNLPVTKIVGQFTHDGVTYDKLVKRPYLINAGLEQAVATLTQIKGSKSLRDYFENTMKVSDKTFLDLAETVSFQGDVYALKEGEIFFGQEQQLRVHEQFEIAQFYESLLCIAMNPQTNVATTANDIADVVNEKVILLEGGSRRATSPQGAILNSRAAIIGGFHASSNVAYGMLEQEKVGGTHGHSYVMLHPDEYTAFKAQSKTLKEDVCFLLDTYDVTSALEKAIAIIKEDNLEQFAFRVDSGDLVAQYYMITHRLAQEEFAREQYKMVASDDLTAGKIADLQRKGAHFDKYLVGTFLVTPPKALGGVYKLAAYYTPEDLLVSRGKFSENPRKATLPGIKQIYRVSNEQGMFVKDIIALEGEGLEEYLEPGQIVEPLLEKVVGNGMQLFTLPTPREVSKYRQERLARLPACYKTGEQEYPVIVSKGIADAILEVRNQVEYEAKSFQRIVLL